MIRVHFPAVVRVDRAESQSNSGLSPMVRNSLVALALALVLIGCAVVSKEAPPQLPKERSRPKRPNILLIVADDLGYSDLGCYGGEIETPNLDRLAQHGRRYAQFYTSVSCSPSRAMLLSGRDNHMVGMGNMHERTAPNQINQPGYEGVLDASVTTVTDVLRAHGYRTMMAGKWHLGHSPRHIPAARGFDRSFSLLNSAGSHFDRRGYRSESPESEFVEDHEYLETLPPSYYSSKTFTDKLLGYIDEGSDSGKPFFAYLAFQAPHDPLHVPDAWLRRYKGKYDHGWDNLREQRLKRMRDLGIVANSSRTSERLWFVPSWDKLTRMAQVTAARKMEIYAAMVEYLDDQVGRVLHHLEKSGELENTVVLFISDNGPESSDHVASAKKRLASAETNFIAQNYRIDYPAWGRSSSYVAYGIPWAQASATPLYMFKGSMYEGGIRSPLIVWQPGIKGAGGVDTDSVMHIADVGPTLLELAGVDKNRLLSSASDQEQVGKSWMPLITSGQPQQAFTERSLGMEMWGGRVWREGRYKAVWMHAPFGIDGWQLFDVVADPAERFDLAAEQPKRLKQMIESWNAYAKANNVILPDRTVYDGLEDAFPPKPPVESPGWPRGQEPNWKGRKKS